MFKYKLCFKIYTFTQNAKGEGVIRFGIKDTRKQGEPKKILLVVITHK